MTILRREPPGMNPNLRRLVITVSVLGVACSIVLLTLLGRTQQPGPQQGQQAVTPQAAPVGETEAPSDTVPPQEPATTEAAAENPEPRPAPLPGVRAKRVAVPDLPPATLGSLDPREARMLLEFSATGDRKSVV